MIVRVFFFTVLYRVIYCMSYIANESLHWNDFYHYAYHTNNVICLILSIILLTTLQSVRHWPILFVFSNLVLSYLHASEGKNIYLAKNIDTVKLRKDRSLSFLILFNRRIKVK